MTGKELKRKLKFTTNTIRYHVGDCLQVNEHTFAVCHGMSGMYLGQFWIVMGVDLSIGSYEIASVQWKQFADHPENSWYVLQDSIMLSGAELDSFTRLLD